VTRNKPIPHAGRQRVIKHRTTAKTFTNKEGSTKIVVETQNKIQLQANNNKTDSAL
jgi:hypothetical protein